MTVSVRSGRFAIGDQRADADVGKDFQQHGIRYTAVNDMRAVHAALDGFEGAANLRQHAAIDGAIGDQFVDL